MKNEVNRDCVVDIVQRTMGVDVSGMLPDENIRASTVALRCAIFSAIKTYCENLCGVKPDYGTRIPFDMLCVLVMRVNDAMNNVFQCFYQFHNTLFVPFRNTIYENTNIDIDTLY